MNTSNAAHPDAIATPGNSRLPGSMRSDDMPGLVITDRAAREQVQHRAYALWQQAGCPSGRHLDHWLTAESEAVSHRGQRIATGSRGG